MNQSYVLQKEISSPWGMLWKPMFLVALGIHALLLFVPFQSQKQESSTSDQKSVKLTRLTALQPAQKPVIPPKPGSQKISIFRKPAIIASPLPVPSVTPTPTTTATPSPPTKKATAPKPPAKAVQPTQTKSSANEQIASLNREEVAFVKRLQKLKGREVTEPVSSTLFNNPEDFYTDSEKDLGKPGIVGIEYISYKQPDDVYQQLIKLYPDYTVVPQGEYGNGSIYEIKKGNFVRYFNLVKAKLSAGTLVVLWSRKPG